MWLNDYRLACQLGGVTTDEVIIRNLPLHLADSARTWLEHLPASHIHNWDDLVRTFVGNFQGYTHLLVAIDKFSKWVEVHPITNLRAEQVVTFFTDIIYRFGVPNSIITDNRSQFTDRKFLEFRDKFHIRVDWAALAHPQTNG
jgi:transposase InsO family protein